MIFIFFSCMSNELTPIGLGRSGHSEGLQYIEINENFLFSDDELQLMEDINFIRTNTELPELIPLESIGYLARFHSEEMASGVVELGHNGFYERILSLNKSIEIYTAAENIGVNSDTSPLLSAVEGWMGSEDHKENILGDYNYSGVGIAYDDYDAVYLTQIFVFGTPID